MKKIVTICTILSLYLNSLGQVSLHQFFPMDISGIHFGDTMLNKKAILIRERITKIISYRDSIGSISTFGDETKTLNKKGAVEKAITCIKSKKANAQRFCTDYTIIYDNDERIIEHRMVNGAGLEIIRVSIEYLGNGRTKETIIAFSSMPKRVDTIFSYRYYNEKGQLIRVYEEGEKTIPGNAYIYYNDDGFPDSIRYDGHLTEIFTRKQKRGYKEIQFNGIRNMYKWMFNSSGQCISLEYKYEKPSKMPHGKVNYYYNADGTLSKVIEKKDSKMYCTTFYSYEK